MSERQLVRRGNVLPLGEYRTPDGKTEYGYAVPNMLMGFVDAYNALGYAGGLRQDPNAPQGYVSQNALMRGGEGIAGSATLGSFATRAPAGALRSGLARELKDLKDKYTKLDQRRQELEFGPARNQDDPALDVEFNRVERELNALTGLANRKLKKIGDDEFENLFQQGLVPEMWSGGKNSQAAGLAMELARNQGREAPQIRYNPEGFAPPPGSRNIDIDDGGGRGSIRATSGRGYVYGKDGSDPMIKESFVDPEYRGTGSGADLYRAWAQYAAGPFRSDKQVSSAARTMYEGMLPREGYNVLRNPTAYEHPSGTTLTRDGRHAYRVEPPGMNSTEFYTNPLAGALPMMWRREE